jgi:hypothetical protein
MRPRAKRRLALVAVTASIVVGAAVVFAIATFGTSSRSGSQTQSTKPVYGTFGAFGIAYGVRGSRLLTRFGRPDRKRNGCWIYRIHGDAFRGIELNAQTAGMDAVRYCFFSGVVATIENHWPPGVRNTKPSGEWLAPLTYGCGGGPCKLNV